jgi:isoleucyl-tRNA synthetase
VLGPKYGRRLPAILAALRAVDAQAAARALGERGQLTLDVGGEPVTLTADEVEVVASAQEGYVAAEDHGYVAVLETEMTPELLAEGLVRDLTHYLQDVRKRTGLEIEDTIETWLVTDAEMAQILEAHARYLADETLSERLSIAAAGTPEADQAPARAYRETLPANKLGGHEVAVAITRR